MLIEYWSIYTRWLEERFPPLYNSLIEGASKVQLTKFQESLGFELSQDFFDLYTLNNGSTKNATEGVFLGFKFLSLTEIAQTLNDWKQYKNDSLGSSYPQDAIQVGYTNPKWIPLFSDFAGNHIGIDFDPAEKGQIGQVINFGRDQYEKFVVARDLTSFFELISNEVLVGNVDNSIVEEEPGIFSFGLRPQSHLIEDLREIVLG
ncbi:hypothetical protein BFP97_00530 [Roseivirga sp. 4D4]|uniref:SMI1/KNR4 family protein n=1 Tax=Roseivirga sp. 4D4 TaxID=1889784 RepID=UPI000852DAEC|nr:SMI1/KNR4 family protein [Roseivirga sp. 4D4]OEK00090.1 hypothetical protein BFP97_00530 [Roseivirga sp. 4D4]